MSRYYKNSEGYSDPTAGEAISNIMRASKRKARSDRRKAQRKQNRQIRKQEMNANVDSFVKCEDSNLKEAKNEPN